MANHLGTREGEGELFVSGNSEGSVRYHLDIWRDIASRTKFATGEIWADIPILDRAQRANDIQLVFSDGQKVSIVIKEFLPALMHADIVVNGGVPSL